ncbi:MAG: thioredoxin family protein, partial [Endomicrobiales bacterium]
MTGKIKYINSSEFEKEVLAAERAAVDFYSTDCPPCDALAAKFEPLSELYGDEISFIKIFRQENRPLAESLGVTSSPTVLFYRQGKLTGGRLSGAVRREDLMRNLDALIGDRETIEKIHAKVRPVRTEIDVLILGAGPAGLAAAIYAAQAKLKTLVADTALAGGQAGITHQVSNYPGFAEPVAGHMLMHAMREQAKKAG